MMSSEHSELRTIKHRLSEILPRVGAAILCCVAVTLTVLNVQRAKSRTQEADTTPQKLVQDWRSYGSDGDWLGPRTAKLVVIEFSDYECSACGVLAGRLAALQKRLPSFSIVVRQFPLPLHIVGTNAARAAKCASAAGHFDQFDLAHSASYLHPPPLIGIATHALSESRTQQALTAACTGNGRPTL